MVKRLEERNGVILKLKKEVSEILEELENLGDNERTKKNNEIKNMINYYNGLTDKIEDRRVRINNFSLQILAVSIAASVVLITSKSVKIDSDIDLIIFYAAMVTFLVLITSSLITSIFFLRQSSFRYPFLKIEGVGVNQWKWFYYGNKYIERINRNPIWPSKKHSETNIPYLKGLKYFVNSYIEENSKKEIRNNIQQLYLLQVHNYYKNKFYLQLTKIWEIGFKFVVLVIVGAIIFISSAWYETNIKSKHECKGNAESLEKKCYLEEEVIKRIVDINENE